MVDKDVEFSDEANFDFHKAQCFMEFNGKLEEFWNDVNRQDELIKEFPFAFQIRYKNVRIVPLEDFNYSFHYIVKPKGILVYRFLNQSQNF